MRIDIKAAVRTQLRAERYVEIKMFDGRFDKTTIRIFSDFCHPQIRESKRVPEESMARRFFGTQTCVGAHGKLGKPGLRARFASDQSSNYGGKESEGN